MTTTQRAHKPAQQTLGEIFSAAYDKLDPRPSYAAVASAMSMLIGRRVSGNAPTLYNRDEVQDPDPVLVAALAYIYELDLADLPEATRARCEHVGLLFDELRTPPGTRTRNLQVPGRNAGIGISTDLVHELASDEEAA